MLDQSAIALHEIADATGLADRRVGDVTELTVDELAAARVVALFTIGETPWSPDQRATLLSNVRAGHTAIVAIHAATDSCYGWSDYGRLVGARFDGHPWTQEIDLEVTGRDHPATRHLGPTWRVWDEVYQFRDLRPDAQVLLRVPVEQLDLDAPGARRPDFGFPLSWCFREQDGRVGGAEPEARPRLAQPAQEAGPVGPRGSGRFGHGTPSSFPSPAWMRR